MVLFFLIFRFANKRGIDVDAEAKPRPATPLVRIGAVALSIVMLVAAGTFDRWRPMKAVPLGTPLVGLPSAVGSWESRRTTSLESALAAFDFDEKLARGYVAPDGSEVHLFLGYFEGQRQGRELSSAGLLEQVPVRFRSPVPELSTGATSGMPSCRTGVTEPM